MMKVRSVLLGAVFALASVAAHAQNNAPSPGGSTVPYAVQSCLNSSGQAVPMFNAAGVWQCSGATIPVSGAVTIPSPLAVTLPTSPTIAGGSGVVIAPSSESSDGITPVVSTSGESSHVLKNAAGNAYSASATNLTTTAGFLVLLNATSAPGDGAITPLACAPLPASGAASINYGAVPARYSTGITAVVTSASTCLTKTTGVITAFISGQVQ